MPHVTSARVAAVMLAFSGFAALFLAIVMTSPQAFPTSLRHTLAHVTPHLPARSYDFSALPLSMVVRSLPVGKYDYALAAHGGTIYHRLTTHGHVDSPLSAATVIDDDFRINGCWTLPSPDGQIAVVLAKPIRPYNVTIDHVPSYLAADISQAPRRMVLWGLIDGAINKNRYANLEASSPLTSQMNRSAPPIADKFMFVPLAEFEYSIHNRPHVQTFDVAYAIVASNLDVGLIVLEVVSNWGADVTCLYRMRVHGE